MPVLLMTMHSNVFAVKDYGL